MRHTHTKILLFNLTTPNTFGGLPDFVSPNPLEETNVVGDNLAMKIGKSKDQRPYF
jgi:hypothetical protein